jgi:hypothetical protein
MSVRNEPTTCGRDRPHDARGHLLENAHGDDALPSDTDILTGSRSRNIREALCMRGLPNKLAGKHMQGKHMQAGYKGKEGRIRHIRSRRQRILQHWWRWQSTV